MSEFKTHQPHVLRPHLNEWCGGTNPPTIVTVDTQKESAMVDIFEDEKFVHDGILGKPESSLEVLHDRDRPITHDTISLYACNALASFTADAK